MSHANSAAARYLVAITLGLVALGLTSTGIASKKAEQRRQAELLTKEALHREAYAQQEKRDELLQKASEHDPDYAPAKWHQGFVRYLNRWVDAESLPLLTKDNSRLARYEHIRQRTPDTQEGHLELANWCRQHNLQDQERAHLSRVLDFAPDNQGVRDRLGFRRINSRWRTNTDLAADRQQSDEIRQQLSRWQPKLEKIRRGLEQDRPRLRQSAGEQLRKIRDVEAIPAIEIVFAGATEGACQLAVETLGGIPQFQAAHALARIAVFSPWESVRLAAATQLASRDKEDYVPLLIAEMYSPVVSRQRISPGPRGEVVHRHEFVREAEGERQHMVLDTAYRRIARPGGDRNQTLSQAFVSVFLSAMSREQALQRQNRLTNQLNDRIAAALNTATKQKLESRPDVWWAWWNDYNEVYRQGPKYTNTIYRAEVVTLVDATGDSGSSGGGGFSSPPPAPRSDCLAAGSQVWTATGPKAIERVRVGDLVLSQHPDSGELAYKPVVRTTVRPKGQLVRLFAGGEVFETSGGHLFWTSGEGWVKARELKPGMVLHGARRLAHVSRVEMGDEQETFNVVVADFHTYFVGQQRILSHDNTIRRPTNATVPGLE